MALFRSVSDDSGAAIRLLAIAVVIVVVAYFATMLFSGPAAVQSFELTSDPASSLWSW